MDIPEINAETIEAMIAKFYAIGEQNWKSPTPVERSRLPSDTQQVLASNYVKT